MVRESQTSRARVTQIQVRVDCKGCVQKIKKALNGIHGIHDLRVDFDRQRLTIIGWADPEKVIKAIKKTKKNATICSNIELTSSSKPTQPELKENATTAEEPIPPAQAIPSSEPTPTQHNARQQRQNHLTEDEGQIHMTHHQQANYVNRFSSGRHRFVDYSDRSFHDTSPVTHSYNTYKPSSYVTEYECVGSPSWQTHYNRLEHYYNEDYRNDSSVNIAAMFSDDNPNACRIV